MEDNIIHQGIWIDRHKAYIFTFKNGNMDLKFIESEIETRNRIEGESKSAGRFGDQYLDPEKRKTNRTKEQTDSYLKSIKRHINPSAKRVVFGPAGMKIKLSQILGSSTISGVENADSMTENQMGAWIRNYFKL